MLSTCVTENDPNSPGVYWRYASNHLPAFNPIVFDETRLAEQSLISGQAGAGRGNTFFVNLESHPLVLRHYRRGGLARRVSAKRYVYTGLSRTRAMREFDICLRMHNMQLPVPKPFACRVVRHGLSYEASIVTHRLAGETLAERLCQAELSDEQWKNIGSTLALFHAQGIYHADLNAHNILLSDEGRVSLIDFDRACFYAVSTNPSKQMWCLATMNRLQRSLIKVVLNEQQKAASLSTDNESTDAAKQSISALSQHVSDGYALLNLSWSQALN